MQLGRRDGGGAGKGQGQGKSIGYLDVVSHRVWHSSISNIERCREDPEDLLFTNLSQAKQSRVTLYQTTPTHTQV